VKGIVGNKKKSRRTKALVGEHPGPLPLDRNNLVDKNQGTRPRKKKEKKAREKNGGSQTILGKGTADARGKPLTWG